LMAACERFDHEAIRAVLLRAVVGYAPQGGLEDFILRQAARHEG
jgi:hypothetical protein